MMPENRAIWTFLDSGTLFKNDSDEDLKQLMLALAGKNLSRIHVQLDLVECKMEISPGIRAIAASRHTPGHMALAISSGTDLLPYISDAAFNPIRLEQPELTSQLDSHGRQA